MTPRGGVTPCGTAQPKRSVLRVFYTVEAANETFWWLAKVSRNHRNKHSFWWSIFVTCKLRGRTKKQQQFGREVLHHQGRQKRHQRHHEGHRVLHRQGRVQVRPRGRQRPSRGEPPPRGIPSAHTSFQEVSRCSATRRLFRQSRSHPQRGHQLIRFSPRQQVYWNSLFYSHRPLTLLRVSVVLKPTCF